MPKNNSTTYVFAETASDITGIDVARIKRNCKSGLIRYRIENKRHIVSLEDTKYLTYPCLYEIADRLGKSRSSTSNLIKRKHKIKGMKKVGRFFRIPPDEAEKFIHWYAHEKKEHQHYHMRHYKMTDDVAKALHVGRAFAQKLVNRMGFGFKYDNVWYLTDDDLDKLIEKHTKSISRNIKNHKTTRDLMQACNIAIETAIIIMRNNDKAFKACSIWYMPDDEFDRIVAKRNANAGRLQPKDGKFNSSDLSQDCNIPVYKAREIIKAHPSCHKIGYMYYVPESAYQELKSTARLLQN